MLPPPIYFTLIKRFPLIALLVVVLTTCLSAQVPPDPDQNCVTGSGSGDISCFVYINEPGSSVVRSTSISVTVPKGRQFAILSVGLADSGINFGWNYSGSATVTGGDSIKTISYSGPFVSWCYPTSPAPGYFIFYCNATIAVPTGGVTAAGPATLTVSLNANGAPGPVGSTSGSGNSFDMQASLSADIKTQVTMPDYSFRPRDAAAPAAESGCEGSLAFHCRPVISYGLVSSRPILPKLRYGLRLVSPTNLTGTASNVGDQTTPDFDLQFDGPNAGSQNLDGNNSGIIAAQDKQQIAIRSLDYGGSVKINPFVRIYDTRDNSSTDFPVDTIVQPKASGATEKPFNLANLPKLPVDEDNDGMADSWEEAHGGMSLVPDEDKEEGFPGTVSDNAGDGFVAFDEYRGFRTKVGSQLRWISTEPKSRKDLFFWDGTDGPASQALGSIFTPAVATFVDVREVGVADVNKKDPESLYLNASTQAVGRLSRNGRFKDRSAYAVPLLKIANALGGGGTLLAESPSPGLNGFPVLLDFDVISEVAFQRKLPFETELGATIAHEVGHRLLLRHPRRKATMRLPYQDDAPLEDNQFMYRAQLSTLRIYYYVDLFEGQVKLVENIDGAANRLPEQVQSYVPPAKGTTFRMLLAPIVSGNSVSVQTREAFLMDWLPSWTLRFPAEHRFKQSPDDGTSLTSMCFKDDGCIGEPPGPSVPLVP